MSSSYTVVMPDGSEALVPEEELTISPSEPTPVEPFAARMPVEGTKVKVNVTLDATITRRSSSDLVSSSFSDSPLASGSAKGVEVDGVVKEVHHDILMSAACLCDGERAFMVADMLFERPIDSGTVHKPHLPPHHPTTPTNPPTHQPTNPPSVDAERWKKTDGDKALAQLHVNSSGLILLYEMLTGVVELDLSSAEKRYVDTLKFYTTSVFTNTIHIHPAAYHLYIKRHTVCTV